MEEVEDAMEVETAGGGAQREEARQRQRLRRERVRGLSAAGLVMERFLARASPTPQQVGAETVAAARGVVQATIGNAVELYEAAAVAKAIAKAAAERERQRLKRMLTPSPRMLHPRLSRSLEGYSKPSKPSHE